MGWTSRTTSRERRRGGWRLAGALVAVTSLLGVLVVTTVPATADPAFQKDDQEILHGVFQDWMARLPGDATLDRLSIPGTHDSMAVHGGDGPQTQILCGATDPKVSGGDACDVTEQLDAGIRYLDIRVECQDHGGHFELWAVHSGTDEHAELDKDILKPVHQWLGNHPGETVLMDVSHQGADNDNDCPSWSDEFGGDYYLPHQDWFWKATCPAGCGTGGFALPPSLTDARGKMVLIWNHAEATQMDHSEYLSQIEVEGNSPYVDGEGPDDYKVCEATCAGLNFRTMDGKWDFIQDQLTRPGKAGGNQILYITNTAAAEGIVPKRAAGGFTGGSGWVEGLNSRTLGKLIAGDYPSTGVLVSDFPGPELIEQIIYRSTALFRDDVGFQSVGVLVGKNQQCPAITATNSPMEALSIRLDNEDDRNSNAQTDEIGSTVQTSHSTEFFLCRIDGHLLPHFPGHSYAVLKIDSSCPVGSASFRRRIDDQDITTGKNDNEDQHHGVILPSVQTENTLLEFCVIPAAPAGTDVPAWPALGFSYGVFAAPDFSYAPTHGSVRTDDEDNNNHSWFDDPSGVDNGIVTGDAYGTTFNLAWVRESVGTITVHATPSPSHAGEAVRMVATRYPADATGEVCLDDLGSADWPARRIECQPVFQDLPFNVDALEVGTHQMVMRYSGDAKYGQADTPFTQRVVSDVTPPTTGISVPDLHQTIVDADGWVQQGEAVAGLTFDDSAKPFVAIVEIQDVTAGLWWRADNQQWVGSAHENRVDLDHDHHEWSVPLPLAALTDGHTYQIDAAGKDAESNLESPPASTTMLFRDNRASATINYPVRGSSVGPNNPDERTCPIPSHPSGPGLICGELSYGLDGDGNLVDTVHGVRVQLHDATGDVWNGVAWVAPTGLPAEWRSASLQGLSWTTFFAAAAFTPDQTYTVTAEPVIDDPSHLVLGDSVSYTYDLTAPATKPTVTFPVNGGIYGGSAYLGGCTPVGICGTTPADPDVAGVQIAVSYQVGSDPPHYLTSSGFTSLTKVFLPVNGVATWSRAIPGGVLADGGYGVEARTVDAAGNPSLTRTIGFRIDKVVGPATITFPAEGGVYSPAAWTAACGAIAGMCGGPPDDATGVASVKVALQETASNGKAADQWWDGHGFTSDDPVYLDAGLDGPWTFPLAAGTELPSGTYHMKVRTQDNAGNTSTTATRTFTLDGTEPTAELTFPSFGTASPDHVVNKAEWGSGCTPDGCAAHGQAISGTATDQVSAIDRVEVSVRRTSDGRYLTGGSFGSTFSSTTQVWLSAALSGGDWSLALPSTRLTDGEYETVVRAYDKAGNQSFPLLVETFGYDGTPPPVAVALSPAAPTGANGWYVGGASIRVTTSSTEANVECTDPFSYTGPDGANLTVNGDCTDPAGNTARGSATFSLDTVRPTATATPARGPDHGIWYNAPVAVAFSGTDATSGVASCTAPITYSGPDRDPTVGGATVNGRCTDNAGNLSQLAGVSFPYDATAPTFDVRRPAGPYSYGQSVTADFDCLDATSGIATCVGSVADGGALDTSSVGPHSITIAATDKAGNPASTTVTYQVVKATPTVSVTSAPSPSVFGGQVTITATVTGVVGRAVPGGTVTFKDGATTIGTATLGPDGKATITTAALQGGTRSLTASYGGDGRYAAADGTRTQVVQPAPTQLRVSPLLLFALLRPTATLVRSDTGAPIAGQTIAFSSGGTLVCTAVTNAEGRAQCGSTLLIALGGVRGAYPGTSNYQPAVGSAGLL